MHLFNTFKPVVQQLPGPIRGNIFRNRFRLNCVKNNHTIFKVANTLSELENAYRLVHDVFVTAGYIDPHPLGFRVKIHNALPETTTFIAKHHEKIALTLTLFPDSLLGVPMDSAYKRDLDKLRDQGRTIAEVGALASDFSVRNNGISMITNKIIINYATELLGIDDILITVHPRRRWIYESILLFEKIGKIKEYEDVKGNPAVALRLDLKTAPERYMKKYGNKPLEKNVYDFIYNKKISDFAIFESHKNEENIWTESLLSYFFKEKSDVFSHITPKELQYIFDKHNCYKNPCARTNCCLVG